VSLPIEDLNDWIKEHLFDAVPMGIAVIDQAFNVVKANRAFEHMFGRWQGQKCFKVYKNRSTICPQCKGAEAFKDGVSRVNEEVGYNKNGRFTRYIKHTIPIVDNSGQIPYLLELCTDVTETDQIRREYQLLFDQVPCNILLIDRDFRIVKTNQRVRKMLGELEGGYCFKGLKGFDHRCTECTARQTFEDGKLHTGHHVWKTRDGETVHLHVITVPLRLHDGSFDMVMEMAVDVTETIRLQSGLDFAHSFLETLIATSMDGILAVDNEDRVSILNPAARNLFQLDANPSLTRTDLIRMLPRGVFDQADNSSEHVYLPDTTITTRDGEHRPVRLVGNKLKMDGQSLGMAFSLQDLTEIKTLQNEKLEAERLAAVGQTVAGLAHGVKNLITALEGGMYMLNTGLSKSNLGRVQKGIEMLDRNIERISQFVNAFLGFSRGREIRAAESQPSDISREVVSMYATRAKKHGIILRHERIGEMASAAIDYESMHECLTNLVGNAIDACIISDKNDGLRVTVRAYEEDGSIVYEVSDNGCGMDYEIKKKVFTNFFTTKGLGGTGLGLLMTKKIVHEHGGRIDYESEPGEGTLFRIRLPRNRLPKPVEVEPDERPSTSR
jgi:PAS domain S-box-containing protein